MDETTQAAELLTQIRSLLADTQRYRDEARRYRTETRKMMLATREAHGRVLRQRVARSWRRDAIPAFPEPCTVDDAAEGAFLLCHEDSSAEDFAAYRAALLAAGFAEHASFCEGALTTATLYNDRVVVNLSYATSDKILRAIVEPAEGTTLPATERISGSLPVIFRAEGDLFQQMDCGMSYIFRLADGKFLLIDGGWFTPCIADRLIEDLYRLSGGKKPEIAAWIFTHSHLDHIGAFIEVARRHADRIKLDAIVYDFPSESRYAEMGDLFTERYGNEFLRLIPAFGDVKIYKARTGQQYHFAGLDLDILFAYEDYKMPYPLHGFNQTSLVFRIRAAGQTMMFLGDAEESGCAILAARYGELLKSDVVQVAHHGYNGGTDEIYDLVAAPVVLWPAPLDDPRPGGGARYSDPNWSPVTRRMVAKHASAVYVAGEGSVEQELPLH